MEMFKISGCSLNDVTYRVCQKVLEKGSRIQSRNGMTYELINQEVILESPRSRHLYLAGRSSNIFACLAEIFWIMAGEDDLDPLMNFFLKRAKDYSDDGKTWRGAYGPRMYRYGALESAIQAFVRDGKGTRQSVMAIHHPDIDTDMGMKIAYDLEQTKDRPCNNFIWFWIRENRLSMKVGIRSNDVIFGMSAINIPEWTFLQEVVLELLKQKQPVEYKDVTLGHYIHSPVSLHVYDETAQQAKDILEKNDHDKVVYASDDENFHIKLSPRIKEVSDLRRFFSDLYNSLCAAIVGDTDRFSIDTVFSEWEVPKHENQLYCYATLVEAFIQTKLNQRNSFELNSLSVDLRRAVISNKFTPKSWLEE